MRIGVDAMGGDRAPETVVQGALEALADLNGDDSIALVGIEEQVRPLLEQTGGSDRIEVIHAPEVIGMDEAPVEALRSKKNSSIAVMAELHRRGTLNACISAGNTGACVAAATMRLRLLEGVHRPGIAILTPTLKGPVAVCDVGANVACRPQHLHQYALMSAMYLKAVCGVEKPRVGLLSVGEEEAKGNELVKATRDLMKTDERIRFIGNVEGRDLFRGTCDVMVCDGFVGNVVLKLMEGMSEGLMTGLVEEMVRVMPQHAQGVMKAGKTLANKYDFNEYGGAPLLGVAGIWMICHGASDHRGIKNAILAAREFSKHDVNRQITGLLAEFQRSANA